MEYTIGVLDSAPTGALADMLRHIKIGSVLAGLMQATTRTVQVVDHVADLGCVSGVTSVLPSTPGGLYFAGPTPYAPTEDGGGSPGFCTLQTSGDTGRTSVVFADDDPIAEIVVVGYFLPDEAGALFAPWPPVQ
jgi:hypothetical protein